MRHCKSQQGQISLSPHFLIFKPSPVNKLKQRSNMQGQKWISKTKSHTCTLFMWCCPFDCVCCYLSAVKRWKSGPAPSLSLLQLIWSEWVSRSVRRVNISAVQAPALSLATALTCHWPLVLTCCFCVLALSSPSFVSHNFTFLPSLHSPCVMHAERLPLNKVPTMEKSAVVWCLFRLWRIMNCESLRDNTLGGGGALTPNLFGWVQTISGVFVCSICLDWCENCQSNFGADKPTNFSAKSWLLRFSIIYFLWAFCDLQRFSEVLHDLLSVTEFRFFPHGFMAVLM